MQIDGDRERVMPAAMSAAVTNVLGDFANVFILHWGMFGMAFMSSMCFVVQVTFLLFHFRKPNINYKINFKLCDWKGLGKIIFIGMPSALQALLNTLRSIVINTRLLAIAGSVGVAAFSIQCNCQNFFGAVVVATGGAVFLLSNIFYGEEDPGELGSVLKIGLKKSITLVALVAALMFIAAPGIAMFYTSDEEVISLATRALRYYSICLILYGACIVIQNFSQATKKIVLTMIFCLFDEFIFIILPVFILPEIMGTDGFWLSFVVAQVLTLLMYVIIVMVRKKKIIPNFNDFMLLPKTFKVDKDKTFEYTATEEEDVMMASIGAEVLCTKNNIDSKHTNAIALCIEEMAMNIVTVGIKDVKKQRIDIKVVIKDEDIIIRLRDNCVAFNPIEHFKNDDDDDPMAGIGIKMVMKLAKDVNYISTMKLNNLMIVVNRN